MGCPASAKIEYKIKVPFTQDDIEELIEKGKVSEDDIDFEVYTYKSNGNDPEEYYIDIDFGQSVCNCTEIEELETLKVTKSMENRALEIQAFVKKHFKKTVKAKWYLQCWMDGY